MPTKYVTRTITSFAYSLTPNGENQETITLLFDHRLNAKEMFSLFSKYPDAQFQTTPEIKTATYAMPLDDFIKSATILNESEE